MQNDTTTTKDDLPQHFDGGDGTAGHDLDMAARPKLSSLVLLLSATIITVSGAFVLRPTARCQRRRKTKTRMPPGAESPATNAAAGSPPSPPESPRERDTGLFGTLRFTGDAEISTAIPNPGGASLSRFFASEVADPILIGVTNESSTYRRLEPDRGDGKTTLECRQKSLSDFLGLTLTPVITSRITKSVDDGRVVIEILDARTELSEGRIGNTLRRLLERAKFVGENRVSWTERDGGGYELVAKMDLCITVDLPPLLPLPPGFNSLGSKIVRSQSRGRLQESVDDIARAYREWSESERRNTETTQSAEVELVEPVLS